MKRTKAFTRNTVAMALAVTASWNAWAQTTLIDEDFQDPMYPVNTVAPSGFAGWSITTKTSRNDSTSTVPGENYPSLTNQVMHFEQTTYEMVYTNTGPCLVVNRGLHGQMECVFNRLRGSLCKICHRQPA